MTRIDAHRRKRPPKKKAPGSARPAVKQTPPIVVAATPMRLKWLLARRMAAPREPNPEVEAFFARNVRPGGPLPPFRKERP